MRNKGEVVEEVDNAVRARDVQLKEVEGDTQGALGDLVHMDCNYCGKHVILHPDVLKQHQSLSALEFYCTFCLRHRFYTNSRHVLMMTFRSIIGYYYYAFYRANFASQRMYYSQIQEYIATHANVGLRNPVFCYDPESFIWFVDFSRVGKGKGKIKYEDVIKTISDILLCFNLPTHIFNIRMFDVVDRYQDAIQKFYTQRSRPLGKRLLVPTLCGCGIYENHQNFKLEETCGFTMMQFIRKDG